MPDKRVILTVDTNRRNLELLSAFLGKAGYESVSANRLEDFDLALESGRIDLALIDIAGFGGTVWERCDRLRKAEIPFLIISAGQPGNVEMNGISHGARAVLTKPLASKELLGMIQGLLQESV